MDDIITPRLLLRLMDLDTINACLEGDLSRAEKALDVKIPEELLDKPSSLQFGKSQLLADVLYQPWSARAIILPKEQVMIGLIRFHSRPGPEYLLPFAADAVEFGYRIFSKYRRQGYASEAVRAVMDWANVHFGVVRFIVSVSPANHPSLQMIGRLGFEKIGEAIDDTDDLEYVFMKG